MKKIVSLFVFTLTSLCITSTASSVPLDFDSNALSNFSSVRVNSDNSLSWLYTSNSQGTVADLASFGVAGHHLMPGFYAAAETVPGVVTKNGVWRLANGVKRRFGSDNALYLGGADFDGDSLSDIAYATNACVIKK